MKRIPPIKAVMTPFPFSVSPDEAVERAAEMMVEHQIRHLPVVDHGRPIGVVTAREVDPAARLRLGGGDDPPLRVRDVCGDRACVVELDEPLDNVLLRMAAHHLDSALVVRQGKLVGIFTVTDACRRFAELLRSDLPSSGDDAA